MEHFSAGGCKKKKKEKKKKPPTAKRGRENITKSQWEVKIKTSKLSEVREIAPDQAAIGFSFEPNF